MTLSVSLQPVDGKKCAQVISSLDPSDAPVLLLSPGGDEATAAQGPGAKHDCGKEVISFVPAVIALLSPLVRINEGYNCTADSNLFHVWLPLIGPEP